MEVEQPLASFKAWGSVQEIERRNRIRISCYAYAYEVLADPIATDAEYDKLARLINTKTKTGHAKLDKFFKVHYTPYSGAWIHRHPELGKLKRCVGKIRGNRHDSTR
jgi:hypothetical protein